MMEKKTHVIIASVILSIFVWLSVSMNSEYSVSIRVPFRVRNLPDNMALANLVPQTILVRIRGTGWQIASSYISTHSSIEIDAENFSGKRVVLTARDLSYSLDLGSSADVVTFTPDTIIITLDTLISKRVPISAANIEVIPRNGFIEVGEPEIVPDSVTLTGAKSVLSKIDLWRTKPKRFRNVINEIHTKLQLSDTLSEIVQLSEREASVKITIEQLTENTYKDLPIHVINNKDSAKVLLLPPTIDVTVRGGINTISDLTPDSFKVTVDYNNLVNSNSSHVHPNVQFPMTVQLIAIDPDSVEFVIRK
jgi:YbbR domain-containing protein